MDTPDNIKPQPIVIVLPKHQTTYQIKCSACGTFGRYTEKEFATTIAEIHQQLPHDKKWDLPVTVEEST